MMRLMGERLVTKEVLDLYDKYYGDFGLLGERWADQADQDKFTGECSLLSEYVDQLEFSNLDPSLYCLEMRESARLRITELEKLIDPEVVAILKRRIELGEKPTPGPKRLRASDLILATVGLAGVAACIFMLLR